MEINKNEYVKSMHELMQQIEICGASVELTKAVVMAGDIMHKLHDDERLSKNITNKMQFRIDCLEAFMQKIASKLKCLPDYYDSLPDKGNRHIIDKLDELISKSER